MLNLRVSKYIPHKLFGFAGDDNGFEVFFHLGDFQPGPALTELPFCPPCSAEIRSLASVPPPPILGEMVMVVSPSKTESETQRPRATQVVRVAPPTLMTGVVEAYDAPRGYGFIRGADGKSYHLHQSEIADGKLPLRGGSVIFFAGTRQGKPRACHVRICR